MKKPLTAIVLLAGAVSGYSQAQIEFTDYDFGDGGLEQQFFNVQTTAPIGATPATVTYGGFTETEYLGRTAADNPPGAVVFAAGTALSGTGFDAQLFAAAGSGDALSSLTPVGTVLHFWTTPQGRLGLVKGEFVEDIPIDASGNTTLAIAVWNNGNGADTTLAAAQADGEPWGFSDTATVTPNVAPLPPFGLPLTLEGFSLGVNTVPEPGTISLGLLGASAFLFRRRQG